MHPCKNPSCKSFGAEHPNCVCGASMAEGGDVSPFCEQDNTHLQDCEYFAEGGVSVGGASPSLEGMDFDKLPMEAPAAPVSSENLTGQSFDDLQSDEDKYGSMGQQAITFAEGAGQGASFGLSSGLERLAGVDPKDIAMRQSINPGMHAAGEVTGLVGSSLIPIVGEAKLLGAAGKAAAKMAGLEAAESVGGRIASAVVSGSVENALYQATSGEVGKMLAGDPSQSVGTAAANVGLSGLLGGGLGGGFAGTGELWKATAGAKLGKEMGAFVSRLKEGMDPTSKVEGPAMSEAQQQWFHPFSEPMKPVEPLEPSLGTKLADKFIKFGLSEDAGKAMAATAGGILGHHIGLGGFGALIGEHTLGPFMTKTLPLIAKKLLSAGEISAEGIRAAAEYTSQVVKGELALDRAAKGVFNASKEVAFNYPTEKDRDRLEKTLQRLKADPNPMLKLSGATDTYMEGQGAKISETAMNAVNYLNGLRPDTAPKSPLDSKMPASNVDKAQYIKALNIAEQPLIAMVYLKKGMITPQDIGHLQNLYPGLYQRMSEKLMAGVVNAQSKGHAIPYKTRMGLSMFLGQPMDSTLTPQSIQAAQMSSMSAKQQAQNTQGLAGSKASAMGKLPGMYQTPQQASMTRAQKN